jgi:hypothetical protein
MVDIKACANRTAHESHGWTEVADGVTTRLHSMVEASTVLQAHQRADGEGSRALYHHCEGVPDLVMETRASKFLRQDRDRPVYEMRSVPFGNAEMVTERMVDLDAVYERQVMVEPWREVQRLTCFCCSCGDFGADPACRNHGYAGTRPCEKHGTPGSVWDDDGTMPDSVQMERRRIGWPF